jgi:hypothetical protein
MYKNRIRGMRCGASGREIAKPISVNFQKTMNLIAAFRCAWRPLGFFLGQPACGARASSLWLRQNKLSRYRYIGYGD